MKKIDEILKYNKKFKYFYRPLENNEQIFNKNKLTEFTNIIETKLNRPFKADEWTSYIPDNICDSEDDEMYRCICSKKIKHLYYIKHIETDISFQVGSECVKKLDNELGLGLTKNKCKICDNFIMDNRKKCSKKDCCSDFCMNKLCKLCDKPLTNLKYTICFDCNTLKKLKSDKKCSNCGIYILSKYTKCYNCNLT